MWKALSLPSITWHCWRHWRPLLCSVSHVALGIMGSQEGPPPTFTDIVIFNNHWLMDLYYIDIVCFELFFNGLFYFIIIDWSRGLSVFRHISENLFCHHSGMYLHNQLGSSCHRALGTVSALEAGSGSPARPHRWQDKVTSPRLLPRLLPPVPTKHSLLSRPGVNPIKSHHFLSPHLSVLS